MTPAIAGCERSSPAGNNQYDILVTAAIGPVTAKLEGRLRPEDLQPPNAYTMRFEGQGGAAGHGHGNADIRLEAAGPNAPILQYTAHAMVGGKIAQVGSRLVDMAAQRMATEFFESFNAKVQERYGIATKSNPSRATATPGWARQPPDPIRPAPR